LCKSGSNAPQDEGSGKHPLKPTPPPDPEHSVDLHGLRPEQALRRLAQTVHAVRVQGGRELLVVTGRGWGNPLQQPILRTRVEAWVAGPEGQRLRLRVLRTVHQGGALVLGL
jgi:hypothetical protein